MATVTFRSPRRDAIYNGNQIYSVLAWDRPLFSNGWTRIKRAFFISEPHTTGFLHYHGLLSLLRGPNGYVCGDAKECQRLLTSTFGWSSVSAIKDAAAVGTYCAKYVSKAIDRWSVDYNLYGNWKA